MIHSNNDLVIDANEWSAAFAVWDVNGDGVLSRAEFQFNAAAGVKYHIWFRMKADNDYYGNDSVFVQFSGSTDQSGASAWRIGTTDALAVSLQDRSGAAMRGWGWNDDGWASLGESIYFDDSGTQTIRVQLREDGVSLDQIVLSASTYLRSSPGQLKDDTTILQETSNP